MPIVVACRKCPRRFRAPDEFAGRKIKCPICKTALVVGASPSAEQPLKARPVKSPIDSKKAAAGDDQPVEQPKSSLPTNDFDFNYDPSASSADVQHSDSEDGPKNSSPRLRKKKRWDTVASGMGAIQIGLIALAVAALLLLLFSPVLKVDRFAEIEALGPLITQLALLVVIVVNNAYAAILATVLAITIASGIMGFGHISANEAPDEKANQRAVVSLIFSGVSMICWVTVLSLLMYEAYMLVQAAEKEELAPGLNRLYLLVKIMAGFYSFAVTTTLISELFFISIIWRAASLFEVRRLQVLSKTMFIVISIALAVHLAASAVLGFKTLFLGMDALSVTKTYVNLSGPKYWFLRFPILVGALAPLAGYWYTLRTAKRILRQAQPTRRPSEDLGENHGARLE
jgi:hypothetical protein